MCVYVECREGKKRGHTHTVRYVMCYGIYTLWGTRETNKIH